MTLHQTLKDSEYRNWVRGAFALKLTRDGIQSFVENESKKFQHGLLSDVCKTEEDLCNKCTTQNVLRCPTRGVCTKHYGCRYHKTKDSSLRHRPCPNGICGDIFKKIVDNHRHSCPAWRNTDARLWCCKSWELAKCYMPPDGYGSVTCAADTDFTGIINVILNLKHFDAVISEDLSLPGNVFSKARTIRNEILHTATYRLSETTLHGYIDTMILLLNDSKQLATDANAKDSIEKLQKIKSGTLIVTEEDGSNLCEEAYINEKKVLQTRLLQLYEKSYLKMPISPFLPEDDANIQELYVSPCMLQVDLQQSTNTLPIHIEHFRDIFYKNSQKCKKIYISGDAGMGKTTLCTEIISLWCTAHTKMPDQLSEDEKMMLSFQFLFFISLRCASSDGDIEEMIQNQLIQIPSDINLLSKLLDKESNTCLIVLDGLDEWTPPKYHKQKSPIISEGMPGRKVLHQYTILTTTRPWKLEVLRPLQIEIDKKIELKGIDSESSDKLIDTTVNLLNRHHGCNMSKLDFDSELATKNLEQFKVIPVILIPLICLWHDGKPLGTSQCAIYSEMIDMLIEIAEKRLTGTHDLERVKQECTQVQADLPNCFRNKTKCQDFKTLLYSLGRMSYETLFSIDQESSLVFKSSDVALYSLSKAEIYVCLKIGILSQNMLKIYARTPMKTLSFLHKTFQEFLAALFISMNAADDHASIITKVFSICNSTAKMLEMSKVFIFVSGMNPELAYKLSQHIPDVGSKQRYRLSIDEHFFRHKECLEYVQQIKIACVRESRDNGHSTESIKLQLEDFYVTPNTTSNGTKFDFAHLILTNADNIKSVYIDRHTPHDLQENLTNVKSLTKFVSTVHCNADIKTVYSLIHKSTETLATLDICSPKIPFCELQHEQFSTMFSNMTQLSNIRIANIELTHSQIDSLMTYLSKAMHLKHIYLHSFMCSYHKTNCSYQMDLSTHHQLETLYLYNISIDSVLMKTEHLTYCRIWDLYKPGVMQSLLKTLKYAQKLQTFKIGGDHTLDTEAMQALVETLPTLTQLQMAALNDINFGDEIVKLSPEMKRVELLKLSNIKMTRQSLQEFVDSIPKLQHVLYIDLAFIKISPAEDVVKALDYIRSCPRVEVTYDSEYDGNYRIKFHTLKITPGSRNE